MAVKQTKNEQKKNFEYIENSMTITFNELSRMTLYSGLCLTSAGVIGLLFDYLSKKAKSGIERIKEKKAEKEIGEKDEQ